MNPDRIILIDKPLTWTSFDVVNKLRRPLLEAKRLTLPEDERRQLKNYKVGHAGTLDPLATGLLIICSGKFTKDISLIQDAEKEYTGSIIIGAETESYDLEKTPFNLKSTDHVTPEDINSTAKSFVGEYLQTPPIHSAVKIEGVRAYEHARAGTVVELKQKVVIVKEFEITTVDLPRFDFRIVCSKGTYIRSIAHDFGKRIGTGAYLNSLRRTRIGHYSLANAVTPQAFLSELSEKQ